MVPRHKLNDFMEMETRFCFHGNSFPLLERQETGTCFHFHGNPFMLLESQETETCFRFLYSRVCLWSIVVNSAKNYPAKMRLVKLPAVGRFARGQKNMISLIEYHTLLIHSSSKSS